MFKKLFILFLPLFCTTAFATVPELTRFYPDSREKIQEYKPTNGKIYAYFATGSKVVYAKGQLTQAGENLGDVIFNGSATPSTTATMKASENGAMAKIATGEFSITVYEVAYIEDGETKTYSDISKPLATTTYYTLGAGGKIVSETGLEDKTLLSYYKPDGTDGIKTFVLSKPVTPTNIHADLEYGIGDIPYITRVPHTLSEDGLTLTVDFRGIDLSSKALAYGNIFYDLDGKPTAPPTTIVLVVNNLICTDGTRIEYQSVSLDGNRTTDVQGQIYLVLNYNDISLPTPVLKSVEFFPASKPNDVHTAITDGCNMMALTVENLNVLAETDITLTAGTVTATIAWKEIMVSGDKMIANLPTEIIAAGSEALVISLTNYKLVSEDGTTHIIKPLDLSHQVKEVNSVAAVKALAIGETVALNVPGGVTITLSNDMGYCFLEDATDGLFIVTEDYSKVLQESSLLTGKLVGTYQGSGLFMINPKLSDYTEVPVSTSVGAIITDINDLTSGKYDFRLVSFIADSNIQFTSDGKDIIINNSLPVLTDFAENFVVPAEIKDVTGVYYSDPSLGAFVLIRSKNDVNQDITYNPDGIIYQQSIVNSQPSIVNLSGIKVGKAPLQPSLYIINGKKLIKK
ncbi:MAG: hypothetical protein HUK05_03350 [Prevotella sp.]|nr:hypothetical protein [Prevotella sp.]